MRAIGDVEAAFYVDARLREHFDFVDERDRINDDAHADDGMLFGTKDAARDELQDVFFFADDDGVAGVVASGYADDVVKRAREIVDDFALAFVTPLRANDDD